MSSGGVGVNLCPFAVAVTEIIQTEIPCDVSVMGMVAVFRLQCRCELQKCFLHDDMLLAR